MEIQDLNKRPNIQQNKKLVNKYVVFEKLISELKEKELTEKVITSVNQDIKTINAFTGLDKDLSKLLGKTQSKILIMIEKELKLVVKNHYRLRWMAIGMVVFGIPFGAAMGTALDNMAFIGVGIPIGIGIGIGIGTAMDQKAFEKGKQLNLEIK